MFVSIPFLGPVGVTNYNNTYVQTGKKKDQSLGVQFMGEPFLGAGSL